MMQDEHFQNTPEDFLTGRALPPEMLRDLLRVSELDVDVCTSIAEYLREHSGIPDRKLLDAAIIKAGASREAASSLISTLRVVSPEKVHFYIDAVKAWVGGKPNREALFSSHAIEALTRNLSILVANAASIDLMRKADQLLRDVGNEIDSVKFVCDLRPVFDSDRANVEAFVTVTTLRLIFLQQDGQRNSCEIVFSDDELRELQESVALAVKKIEVLQRLNVTELVPE